MSNTSASDGPGTLVPLVLVLALTAALCFSGLGAVPLTDRDEGEYAAVVSAMRRSGSYLVPVLEGRVYLDKPPLMFWLVAGSQAAFGPNEFATRLPFALCAVLLLAALAVCLKRLPGDPWFAAIGVGALGFSPLFAVVARAFLADLPLTLCTTGAILAFFAGTERERPRDTPWYLAAWFLLGLGFLAKGPVVAAIVLPTAALYALWHRRFLAILRQANLPAGVLIVLAVCLPWYGGACARAGRQLWDVFFVGHNLHRVATPLQGHGGGVLYYLPVLLFGAFPAAAAGLAGMWRVFSAARLRPVPADRRERLARLSSLAAVVVFGLFTAAGTKLPHYLLPALPFVAILAAFHLDPADPGGRTVGSRRVFVGLLAGTGTLLLLALLGLELWWPAIWTHLQLRIVPDSSEYALAAAPPLAVLVGALAVAVAGTTLGALAAARPGRQRRTAAVPGVGAAISCAVLLALGAAVLDAVHTPAVRMARDVRACLGPGDELVAYGLWKPTLAWYAGRDVPRLQARDPDAWPALRQRLSSTRAVFVLTRASLRPALTGIPDFRVVAAYDGYLLGGNAPALARWRPAGRPPPAGD